MLSYASIIRGARVEKALFIQRSYRKRLDFQQLLKIRQRLAVITISTHCIRWKFQRYLKSRENIPYLPLELWDIIFRFMDRIFSVPFRQMSKQYSTRYPSRLNGPVCGICAQQAFIPVLLRFEWSGGGSDIEFTTKNGEFQLGKKGDEFCKDPNNIHCLRCARDHTKSSDRTGRLMCVRGCCNVRKPTFFRPFMAYGDWPRDPASSAHFYLYSEMDQQGIGLTKCPRCGEDCKTIKGAIAHVRTVCRRFHDERRIFIH